MLLHQTPWGTKYSWPPGHGLLFIVVLQDPKLDVVFVSPLCHVAIALLFLLATRQGPILYFAIVQFLQLQSS